jgi:biotin carboxyl carrier protein
MEEDDIVTSRLTEREVKLAGSANRTVSVFGHAHPSPPRVSPSPRAVRAGAAVGSGVSATAGAVVSPMDGMVLQAPVAVGDTVERGATVLVLEAMKMEVVVAAPHAGVVRVVTCRPNEAVSKGQFLVEIAAV